MLRAVEEGAAATIDDVGSRGESLARVREVSAGLKEGVPILPSLLQAEPSSTFAALAAAATSAAVDVSPATPTTPEERAVMRALARGTMRGALDAGASDAGTIAAITEGGMRAILDAELPADDVEAYARAFASTALRQPRDVGLTSAVVHAQLASLPNALAEPEALAATGAAILGGARGDPSALAAAALPAMAQAMAWRAPSDDADILRAASLLARLDCALDDAACARLGAVLGEATAEAAHAEGLDAALAAVADALAAAPSLPDEDARAIARGILGAAMDRADGGEGALYDAVARDAIALAGLVPTEGLGIYAGETTRWLLLAPPAERADRLAAASARVLALGADAADPALVERQVALALAPDEQPIVAISATDGVRTLHADQLDGASRLDGLRDIIVLAQAAGSRSTFELHWSGGDDTRVIPMQAREGAHRATLPASALADLPPGALVAFLVVESRDGETDEHGRGDAPFAFVPDREAPRVHLAPPGARGPGFALAWSAEDADGAVESHRVQIREEGGEWRDWLARTSDTRATFHGEPGRAYAFRAFATDTVGHEGAPSDEVELRVPATSPANRAPDVAFREPVEGSAYAADVPVALDASDPDGTAPTLRVCVREAEVALDLLCMHETPALLATLDASALPDGAYRLHAYATDGTRTSEATSGAFALDRAPPALRSALVDATPTRVRVSASVEDAQRVVVEVAGKSLTLTDDGRGVDARGGDGVWAAATVLAPGEHVAAFLATDALGNVARLEETFVVPAALAPTPAAAAGPAPASRVEPDAPVVATGAPETRATPGFAVWLALGALALAARRR